jgi:hypothetical protein
VLLFQITGCASNSSDSIKNFNEPNPLFNPYVLDWIYNAGGKKYLDGENPSNLININFSETLGGATGSVGICVLRQEITDREIFINQSIWNSQSDDNRTVIIRKLLNACYTINSNSYPYPEFVLQGL